MSPKRVLHVPRKARPKGALRVALVFFISRNRSSEHERKSSAKHAACISFWRSIIAGKHSVTDGRECREKLSDIFLTICDKLFRITPNLYKLPCFEARSAELGFKRFPEVGARRGRWCAMQGGKCDVFFATICDKLSPILNNF